MHVSARNSPVKIADDNDFSFSIIARVSHESPAPRGTAEEFSQLIFLRGLHLESVSRFASDCGELMFVSRSESTTVTRMGAPFTGCTGLNNSTESKSDPSTVTVTFPPGDASKYLTVIGICDPTGEINLSPRTFAPTASAGSQPVNMFSFRPTSSNVITSSSVAVLATTVTESTWLALMLASRSRTLTNEFLSTLYLTLDEVRELYVALMLSSPKISATVWPRRSPLGALSM